LPKPFEIVYSPEQYSSVTNSDQPIAWGGINTMQPANVIAPQYTPNAFDVVLRNAEIRSRPALAQFSISAPDSDFILALIPGWDSTGVANIMVAITFNGVYYFNGSTWTRLAGSNVWSSAYTPIAWRIFNNVLYASQSTFGVGGTTASWPGDSAVTFNFPAASSAGYGSIGGRFITELDNHLILLNVTSITLVGGTINFPQRIWWSANGQPTVFDPAVNTNAGFEDLLDVSDKISGESVFGRVGYIFRDNGITEFAPTGQGLAPFDFNHLMASQVGVGNVLPDSYGQYGNTTAFVGQDNIYSLSPTALTPIGGNARDAIFADLGLQSQSSSGPAVFGVIAPWLTNIAPSSLTEPIGQANGSYIYLTYMLFIPKGQNTRVWVYSFAEQNWIPWTLPNIWVTAKPCLGAAGIFAGSLVIPGYSFTSGAPGLFAFAPGNYNDTAQGSTYSYRVEDIEPNRFPTVRRVILMYRDLGPVTITVSVKGVDDNGTVVTGQETVSFGTSAAPGTINTQFVDLQVSCFRPQLSWTKNAGAGNLSIVKATMIGTSEEVTL
jgi:hypothetical protein